MKGKILLIASAAVVAIIVSAMVASHRGTTDEVASNPQPAAPIVSKPAPIVETPVNKSPGSATQPVQAVKTTSRAATLAETAPADAPLKINGYVVQDPEARMALSLVGSDPAAEAYWSQAINDPNLPSEERKDLIEDLNEDGLTDPKNPTPEDMPIIANRMQILEDMSSQPMDSVNAKAMIEAYKDLWNLYNGIPAK
ncbi:MAG TPA: hypothetical protein VMH87_17650 [Pseudomonadales bacterium]|nr:hypothetical protein [Pseudomonadales bacterium]